jgi:hypothetical protein
MDNSHFQISEETSRWCNLECGDVTLPLGNCNPDYPEPHYQQKLWTMYECHHHFHIPFKINGNIPYFGILEE